MGFGFASSRMGLSGALDLIDIQIRPCLDFNDTIRELVSDFGSPLLFEFWLTALASFE